MKKNKDNNNVFAVILLIALLLYALSFVICLYWTIDTSLKTRTDFRNNPLFSLPKTWEWGNYKEVFKTITVTIEYGNGTRDVGFLEMYWNSLWIPLILASVPLLLRAMCAYVLAKYRFKGNGIVYLVVFFAMIIPISNTLPAMLKVLRALGLYQSFWSVLLMNCHLLDMSFLILYATFKSLSWEYAEAAIVDGASNFRIMMQIMIPLVMPTLSVFLLTGFIGIWNDYSINLVFLPNHPMASYGLYQYYTFPQQRFSVPLQLAASVLVTFPTLVVFVLFKDKLMGNVAAGGLKG